MNNKPKIRAARAAACIVLGGASALVVANYNVFSVTAACWFVILFALAIGCNLAFATRNR